MDKRFYDLKKDNILIFLDAWFYFEMDFWILHGQFNNPLKFYKEPLKKKIGLVS